MNLVLSDLLIIIEDVLEGIDKEDIDGGWWETSGGVEFGKEKLQDIRKAFQFYMKMEE